MPLDTAERFTSLSTPTPPDQIQWRQDGKPITRNGKFFARFVAFIDARYVQQRLDEVFPGDWNLHLSPMPERGDEDGLPEVTFKATLTILGLSRECVGSGSTYKNAASDAFKRAAVRFGVAADLYAFDVNWVQIDGDGKFAKPVEDPGEAYARRQQKGGRDGAPVPPLRAGVGEVPPSPPVATATAPKRDVAYADQPCPDCGARMWDNTATRTAKQPLYKCTRRGCNGAVWPEREKVRQAVAEAFPAALEDPYDDGLPF